MKRREVLLRRDQLRLVLRLPGDRLGERRLQRPRVDHRQRVTLMHLLAFGEVHVCSVPVIWLRIDTVLLADTVPSASR